MPGLPDVPALLSAVAADAAAAGLPADAQRDLDQLTQVAQRLARGPWAALVAGQGSAARVIAAAGQLSTELRHALPRVATAAAPRWWAATERPEWAQLDCQGPWLAQLPLGAAPAVDAGSLWVVAAQAEAELLAQLAWLTQATVQRLSAPPAAQELRRTTIRLESLVTHLQDGLLVEDDQGRVTLANRQFCELFGITAPPASLQGQRCVDLLSQAGPLVGDVKAFLARVGQLHSAHQRVRGEMIVLTDDRVLERDFIPYDDGTGNHARMWQYRDITARVRAEQAEHEHAVQLAAANAQLEEATRLKDEFLSSMSHELRTPLNAVLGMSEALADQVFGPVRPEQLRPLQAISDSGQHLLTMINDLLDLARIGAGKLELELDAVDINALAESSVYLMRAAASRKHVALTTRLAPGLPLLQGDGRRIKQILVNLLDNGIKFTGDGGSVGLEVNTRGDRVELTVWDTGQGIAESDLPKLFKPFAQLDRGLNRRHQGAGMGLMMAERLANLHGGGLSVQSELGRGSRFTVHLPLLPAAVTASPPPPALAVAPRTAPEVLASASAAPTSSTAPTTSATADAPARPTEAPLVLIAEDNDLNLEIIQRFLISKGYRVSAVRDGAAALAQASAQQPDLVLMDVQMPGMDGLEATRRMRQDPQLKHLPVVALTALAMVGDRERCIAAGATDYLAKPVSLRQLAQLLQRYLRSELSSTGSWRPQGQG